MKQSKWPDYLFSVTVRFVFGGIFGALAGLLLGYRAVLRWEAHATWTWLVGWFAVWALGGSSIAICNIPAWQTPWYKSERYRDENEDSTSEN